MQSQRLMKRKKALLIANDVTSKYSRRSEGEFLRIAEYIYNMVRQRHGNYMVFLPSHLFLEQVYRCFIERYYDAGVMECIVQEAIYERGKAGGISASFFIKI